MKLKDLIEQYGEYEVFETKGEWCDATHITLGLKKPNPKTVWDLKDGDKHQWVDVTGDVCTDVPWEDSKEDKRSRKIGNVFLTEEEAEKDVERRKVETLLLKHGGRRWFKDEFENWLIVLAEDGLTWFIKNMPIQGVIYFDTEEQAEKAIEQIGAERIIKALFEVR